jgi:hypothetical protein
MLEYALSLTMASSFLLSSSRELCKSTCRSNSHASAYAWMARSKFCALSSTTAVFAICNALDNMLFLYFSRRLSVWSLSPSRKVSWLASLVVVSWLGFLLVDVVSRLVFLFCNLRGRSLVSVGSSLRGERDAEAWRERSCPCVP